MLCKYDGTNVALGKTSVQPTHFSNRQLHIHLTANGIIKNERVAAAMLAVDRANFCKHSPYSDSPQGIGYAVTISAPHMVRYIVCLIFTHI